MCNFTSAQSRRPRAAGGFTLLEVLVSLVIIMLGLLGLAGLMARMQQAELESYQRSQAIVLLYDMVERIQANKYTASCFAFTTNTTSGSPYVGTGATPNTAASAPASCAGASTAAHNTLADQSIAEWSLLLQGSGELLGGSKVGAMEGARGCVSYGGSSTEVVVGGSAVPNTGVYTVTISWQGVSDSTTPAANSNWPACAKPASISPTSRSARTAPTRAPTSDRKSTRLNSSHVSESRMPSSA